MSNTSATSPSDSAKFHSCVSVLVSKVWLVSQRENVRAKSHRAHRARSCTHGSRSGSTSNPAIASLHCRIEFDALQRNLSALLGQVVGRKLVFDDAPADPATMEGLRRRIFNFAAEYNERGSFFSDLAAAEIERMLIMKFLLSHRHNYTHLLMREPPPVSSTAVRAVEEFIEANWDKPIDIEAMVAIAQVSARSLFRQFKKDRGYSPADFAKRVRLGRAREMLEQSRDGTSVIQVALKCGFQKSWSFCARLSQLVWRVAFGNAAGKQEAVGVLKQRLPRIA